MKEPRTFSVTEAQRLGLSYVIRAVEDRGLVMLERHHQKVVMMVPVTPTGFMKFFQLLQSAAETDALQSDPDFQEFLAFMVQMVERKLGVRIGEVSQPDRAEDRATLESDPSAASMGDTRRRRKSAPSS